MNWDGSAARVGNLVHLTFCKEVNHKDLRASELMRDKAKTRDCNQGETMLGVINGWISTVLHTVCEILLSLTVHSPQSIVGSVAGNGQKTWENTE